MWACPLTNHRSTLLPRTVLIVGVLLSGAPALSVRDCRSCVAQDGAAACLKTAAECDEAPASGDKTLAERIDRALALGLPIVRRAAANYPQHRKCFSCHHQTLPMLAVVATAVTPSADDAALIKAQAEFTRRSLADDAERVRAGRDIGGRELTASYGLWALSLADSTADTTTADMVGYLLKQQRVDGHWEVQTVRPPIEESFETSTALAVAGLRRYATGEQKEAADAAIGKAQTWLKGRAPRNQEDRVFRLWGLWCSTAANELLTASRDGVLAAQRDDGGWSQTSETQSDAYATGQTLFVLVTTGVAATDPAILRGAEYLLKTQMADGSWFVKSRSKPIQVYFDNGDPHGKDQFISTPATSWALAALGLMKNKTIYEKPTN